MRAKITYTAGKTYWFGKTRFVCDSPVVVTDPSTIEHCQNTAGFAVTLMGGEKPVRKKAKAKPAKKKVFRQVMQKGNGGEDTPE